MSIHRINKQQRDKENIGNKSNNKEEKKAQGEVEKHDRQDVDKGKQWR